MIVFSFFSLLTGEFKLFVLLLFSAEKLVRQNSFPQTELGALIEVLLSSAMIYLVLKETNQNLKKLLEEILFRYFLL